MEKSEAAKKRLAVRRDAGTHCATRKSLECDKLTLQQRTQLFPIGNLIRGVLDQHQCCKFVGA
jgi:hypothetical protein